MNDPGYVTHAVELQCEADDEAMAAAARYRDGRALEPWEQARVVKKFPKLS